MHLNSVLLALLCPGPHCLQPLIVIKAFCYSILQYDIIGVILSDPQDVVLHFMTDKHSHNV